MEYDVKNIIEKANNGEGLTVEEIIIYKQNVKPQIQHYGKYGSLAKKYIEEHATWKQITLAGQLPEYLHNIDKQADDLYEIMYAKLSKLERYKMTGNYLEDVKKVSEMQRLIEEEILNEIVYVD